MLRFLESSTMVGMLLSCSIMATTACRSGLRTQANEGDPITVEMKVISLQDADRGRSDLVYTMSGCGSGSTNGVKSGDAIVNFQTQNVRKDDTCDVRINAPKSDDNVANWFSEPGLLYEARRVPIRSEEGKLLGTAKMQQLYSNSPRISDSSQKNLWSLSVGLKAPKALTGLCTCKLYCQPSIPNYVSMLESTTDKTIGICEFTNKIEPQFSKIECSKLEVQCGSEFYVGSWPAGTSVDGSQSANVKLPDLKLEVGVPEETSDATIEVVVPR